MEVQLVLGTPVHGVHGHQNLWFGQVQRARLIPGDGPEVFRTLSDNLRALDALDPVAGTQQPVVIQFETDEAWLEDHVSGGVEADFFDFHP